MGHFLFLSQYKCHSLLTLPFNVVSLSLHSWNTKWQVLLEEKLLMQGKRSLVRFLSWDFSPGQGLAVEGHCGGVFSAAWAASAKNRRNAGGPFKSSLQSR